MGHDPMAATSLQASLLVQAAQAGVPVDPETAARLAGALVKFSAADLRVLEVIKDSPAALAAMARLADEDPDAFLRQVQGFLEFSKPKLARVEHTGNAMSQVFVAVEQRETGPPPKLVGKVIEGK